MSVGTRLGTRPRGRPAATPASRPPAAPVYVSGAASVAVRPALESPRRPARVLAAFPLALYLEVRSECEPHVVAVVTGEATRLPNAVVLGGHLGGVSAGDDAWVGDGGVEVGGVSIRVRRWWDPAPPLAPAGPERLAPALDVLGRVRAASPRQPGLASDGAPALLERGCLAGSLLESITAAERLIGLGPGLTPSGDDMLAGLLVALRHLGAAAGAPRAVWLADWLAAAVTYDARTRTTPISATLLHCAARGETSPEVTGVLRGVAGHQPLEPALRRLLGLGHTSGADLAWGVQIGLSAVLALREDQ
ncbi:hypothetical protein GCM10010116_37980 [Microbispora rosea subsp. aerata]|nr:DUF2877 domain-containing protein [Microbispora rosea]GGO18870.1 hypothetical protein GCM10010116_37980 [Microbispora rosea subsp. aerata]GIH54304.1 hypothetical protein Mro02_12180 [Microbispora rosea subsp. aerata]GLJ81517.1 hypothetical protein GCM10017588_02410 [Microbispora rosea subsp. aerata]